MRTGEEFSAELTEYSSYAGGRYGNFNWNRAPGRNRIPAEAEDALGPTDSPRGYSRGRSGLYYSPPGTSYTIVERPSSGMHHHSSRDREFTSQQHYSKNPRGTYLGSNQNFDRALANNKKRPISPEQVLRLFGTQNQSNNKLNVERPRRSPASSPASTTHQVNYRVPSYGFSIHELVTRTVTMVRDPPEGTHGFGICVKGGKEAGVGVYISRVEEGSVAERAGLRPGDSILEVNGTPFTAITHEEALKVHIIDNMACLNIKELCLKKSNLQQDVLLLKQWSETQKDLPKSSDLLLYLCLHSCFYNVDKAKQKIKSFYNQRRAWPAVFKNRNPSIYPFRTQFNIAVVWPLNYTTPEGYKIIFVKITNSDASLYDLEGQLKLVFVVLDYWARLKGDQDFVILIDHDGFTWSHLPKYRFGIIKKYMAYSQEGLPMILKQVHFIHLSGLTQTLFKITKLFMNKETSDLLHYHHNIESLYNYIPQRCLPKDLGGNDVSISDLHKNMIETVLAHSDLFEKEDDGSSELYG